MSLQLISYRESDIEADVLVHFYSPSELRDNSYWSSEIFRKAGPLLRNSFPGGAALLQQSTVLTRAYDYPLCRYIIHAVGIDQAETVQHNVKAVSATLDRALETVRDFKFNSAVIQLPCFQDYFTTEHSFYKVFLNHLKHYFSDIGDDRELTVYLAVSENDIGINRNHYHSSVEEYISDNYIDEQDFSEDLEDVSAFAIPLDYIPASQDYIPSPMPSGFEELSDEDASLPFGEDDIKGRVSAYAPLASGTALCKTEIPEYELQDKSFIEMVDWWIERKNIRMKDFYIQANLNRAMLSNLRCHPDQLPKKGNAVACAIGLRLTLEEAEDLIGRAGFSFSKYVKSDVVVEYFISHGIYDIFAINEELFSRDLALLGTG